MTPVEIIAAVLIISLLVKILFLFLNKEGYVKFAKNVYSNSGPAKLVIILLAAVVFYYLLQELTIIQIFAVMGFMSLLIALEFLEFKDELISLMDHVMAVKFSLLMWCYLVFWIFLCLWGLKVLFF